MQDIILELLNALDLGPNDKILDFGCGEAKLAKFINQNGFICYGTDIQEKRIHSAQIDFQNNNLDPDLLRIIQTNRDGYTIRSPFFKLPFADNFFDAVISFQVFEHISNLEEVIAELHRVTKDKARVYLEFPSSYVLIEPHLNIPLVQHIKYGKFRERYIELFARIKKSDDPKSYAKFQNDYLHTSCFYRSHRKFDRLFQDAMFNKMDFSYRRRSLRLEKDRVFNLKDLLLYKLRKHNSQSQSAHFESSVKSYLKIHASLNALFVNRMLVFIKGQ